MSALSYISRKKLELLFGMSTGYVIEFNNNSFSEFILEKVGKDIYQEKYSELGSSKANRLRTFRKVETIAY
ncbi:MAG: hypothetical protein ACM3O3_10935 [Syntrophothermus sp.]